MPIITTLIEWNPNLPGTKSWDRFDLYQSGITVQEFLDRGGLIGDIYWDLSRACIAASDYPYGQSVTVILNTEVDQSGRKH